MFNREYPVKRPSSAPATGRFLYQHIINNIKIPASATHKIWYEGEKSKLLHMDTFAFRGDIPVGKTLELLTLEGKPIEPSISNPTSVKLTDNIKKTDSETYLYTLDGSENYIQVSDLSKKSRTELGIPDNARDKDKVYNSNFKPYEQLPEITRFSNELAALSVPKSFSSYLAGIKKNVNYSERDVLELLSRCLENLSSPEMTHILHGNNLAWSALAYIREEGNVKGDIMTEFYGQNPVDFYAKDIGTVLPTIFYALANLGQDPLQFYNMIDIEIWGAEDAAKYMRKYMPVLTVIAEDK